MKKVHLRLIVGLAHAHQDLELLRTRNIYIHSPNLSSCTTYGGKGESNILKKIPVSSDFGYLIIDNYTSTHEWLQ